MKINERLNLAHGFLEQTGTNIFLTGKAGTGKTTFLHVLRSNSPKRMIVVAPTGVAAINAGGVTMHSFFQIPFGPYISGMTSQSREMMRFSREKIAIIRAIDLLVIDEISMVRADMLDAVSDVLCRYRGRDKPFGGVQLLMIGDLQQLAPVVKDDEWSMLREHYASPYFFESKALRRTAYHSIELNHIYRQSDTHFIELLNRVRDNRVDAATLAELNKRHIPGFEPAPEQGYITLASHNNMAKAINDRRLDDIYAQSYRYEAIVEGDFPEYSYPTERSLVLKKDAQVMFVKNDSSPEKRYYNGKIGIVTAIGDDHIEVTTAEGAVVSVEPAEWTNTRYAVNHETKQITESVEGKFTQYPLKTAWAITIHKSQGLTFERAIIDAAGSFAHGQVYVALSRCRSLEGLVLKAPLTASAVISDLTVNHFTRNVEEHQPDGGVLAYDQKSYYLSLLAEMFDFDQLSRRLQILHRIVIEDLSKLYPALAGKWETSTVVFNDEITAFTSKFRSQIERLFSVSEDYASDPVLDDRVRKGAAYFFDKCNNIVVPLIASSRVEVDNKEVRKSLGDALSRAHDELSVKVATLASAVDGFSVLSYLESKSGALLEKPQTAAKAKRAGAKKTESSAKAGSSVKDQPLDDISNTELFELLRQWRKAEADAQGVPAFVVMHQRALIAVVNTLPRTLAELTSIKGVGKKFAERYGGVVLGIVGEFI